jgi:AcrR family transcriptional regulator
MKPLRAPRADNRLPLLLDAAARLFRAQGFHGASIRDIVRAVDMLPGSLYYHFATKEYLLVAVYAEGVRRITERVGAAVAGETDPWARLEAACVAHLESLLEESDYAQVVIRVRPGDVPAFAAQLVALRDGYERLFVDLVAALPLARGVDRSSLRLMLLGALNWSQDWYRPGRDSPGAIARRFVGLLRSPLAKE